MAIMDEKLSRDHLQLLKLIFVSCCKQISRSVNLNFTFTQSFESFLVGKQHASWFGTMWNLWIASVDIEEHVIDSVRL